MRVLVISCFARKTNYSRGNFIYEYFKNNNHDCYLVHSEFQHGSKKFVRYNDDNWIPIKTLAYNSNVSVKRLSSHLIFGIKTMKVIKRLKPELVYIAVPPNSVSFLALSLSKKLGFKTIVDIVDLWPESLPFSNKLKRLFGPILNFWKSLRESKLETADSIMYECSLYQEFLEKNIKKLKHKNTSIIHLAKSGIVNSNPKFQSCVEGTLNICYLGYINNLIDTDLIIKFLGDINKKRKVKLSIIGTGDKKDLFISDLKKNNIEHIDYGTVFEEDKKNKIMAFCDFGLNLYKGNTMIGLTYKSIDYLSAGLPLINSIKSDTWDFVENSNIGINITRSNYTEAVNHLINIDSEKISKMKKDAFDLYLNNFEKSVIERKMDKVVFSLFPEGEFKK